MQLQYISDGSGHTTAVQIQIPIEEWDNMKKKYKELGEEERAANEIPEWQMELGRKELQNVATGNTQLVDWAEAKKQFKI